MPGIPEMILLVISVSMLFEAVVPRTQPRQLYYRAKGHRISVWGWVSRAGSCTPQWPLGLFSRVSTIVWGYFGSMMGYVEVYQYRPVVLGYLVFQVALFAGLSL